MAFEPRRAIVTGSDSGIGRATAVALAKAGMDVGVTCSIGPGSDSAAGDAREIASVIACLASADASYVTGASWAVDGGMLQMGPQAGSHITSDEWRTA